MPRYLLALFLLIGLLVTACGDDETASSAAAPSNESSPFPVTIEHRYGATEIPRAPKRIVTVGLNEQDAFFALGVAPVAVTDWMGLPNGIGPSQLLTSLGLELSPDITKLFVKDYAGKISEEQIGLLDLDAVVWFATPDEARKLERNRVYTSLAVHKEKRDFVMLESRPDKAYNAIGFSTVLSIPSTLDVLVPALAAITDGDPSTVPEE